MLEEYSRKYIYLRIDNHEGIWEIALISCVDFMYLYFICGFSVNIVYNMIYFHLISVGSDPKYTRAIYAPLLDFISIYAIC